MQSYRAKDTTDPFKESLTSSNIQESLDDKHKLRISIKDMNDTMGPDGIASSLLLFGFLPSFPCPEQLQDKPNGLEHYAQQLRKCKKSLQ